MHTEKNLLVVLDSMEAKYRILKNLCNRNKLKGF